MYFCKDLWFPPIFHSFYIRKIENLIFVFFLTLNDDQPKLLTPVFSGDDHPKSVTTSFFTKNDHPKSDITRFFMKDDHPFFYLWSFFLHVLNIENQSWMRQKAWSWWPFLFMDLNPGFCRTVLPKSRRSWLALDSNQISISSRCSNAKTHGFWRRGTRNFYSNDQGHDHFLCMIEPLHWHDVRNW